jgi:hypothetical protein
MEDIGNIFKKRLQETESDVKFDAELEWFFVKPKVRKLNFLTKGFYHFNIYYVFVGVMLISALLFIRNFNTGKNVTRDNAINLRNERNSKITSEKQEIYSEKESSVLPMIQASKDLKGGHEFSISIQQDTNSNISLPSQPTFVNILNTTKDTTTLRNIEINNDATHSKKPVVIINRQDTITSVDTLRKIKTRRVFK